MTRAAWPMGVACRNILRLRSTYKTQTSRTVPKVDLLDISREPTDDELAALMHAVGDKVRIESVAYGALIAALLAKALIEPEFSVSADSIN
jgi:hypothetical protein